VTSILEGVRLVGPSTASLLVTVEVPVTIALAAVVLKQHLTPTQFVGAGLVVAAIVTMQLRLRPRGEAPLAPVVSLLPRLATRAGEAEASPRRAA
jgi:hypothetical protein